MQSSLVQLRDAVVEQYSNLQQDLACSDVVELPAGVPYLLRSSAVLLKGTLKVSGRPYVEGRKGMHLIASIHLPSLPCDYCKTLHIFQCSSVQVASLKALMQKSAYLLPCQQCQSPMMQGQQ